MLPLLTGSIWTSLTDITAALLLWVTLLFRGFFLKLLGSYPSCKESNSCHLVVSSLKPHGPQFFKNCLNKSLEFLFLVKHERMRKLSQKSQVFNS